MGYCTWAGMNEANRICHDTEWGIPCASDTEYIVTVNVK